METKLPNTISGIQRWILTSNPNNKRVWPGKTRKHFEEELLTHLTHITKQLYRGTKFPWIEARHMDISSKASLDTRIETFLEEFDRRIPLILTTITSFTTKKTKAQRFASEAKGAELMPGVVLNEGYIHILEPPVKGVDVYLQSTHQQFIKLPGSDEAFVAKDEKEILLVPGTVLIPVSRKGRFFTWRTRESL